MAPKFTPLASSLPLLAFLLSSSVPQGHAWVGSAAVAQGRRVAISDTAGSRGFSSRPWTSTTPRQSRLAVHQSVDLDSVAQTQEFEFHVPPQQQPLATTQESLAVDPTTDAKIDANVQTVLNGLLLTICFGYAAYEILNIDHGMQRGWTQSEIAMRIPLDNWNNYETALAEKPIYTKTLINVVIYLLGDWLSQTLFQGKNALEFDAMR